MKLFYEYMVIFLNFSPTSNHLHPLEDENCDSNSRLVVDEDDNGKFRLEKVKPVLGPIPGHCHVCKVGSENLLRQILHPRADARQHVLCRDTCQFLSGSCRYRISLIFSCVRPSITTRLTVFSASYLI